MHLYTAAQATLRGKARSLAAAASDVKRAEKARRGSRHGRGEASLSLPGAGAGFGGWCLRRRFHLQRHEDRPAPMWDFQRDGTSGRTAGACWGTGDRHRRARGLGPRHERRLGPGEILAGAVGSKELQVCRRLVLRLGRLEDRSSPDLLLPLLGGSRPCAPTTAFSLDDAAD